MSEFKTIGFISTCKSKKIYVIRYGSAVMGMVSKKLLKELLGNKRKSVPIRISIGDNNASENTN